MDAFPECDLHEPHGSVHVRRDLRVQQVELHGATLRATDSGTEPAEPGLGQACDEGALFLEGR